MPAFCAVLNCSDKYGHAENISFHKFPFKRKDLLQQWLDFTGREDSWQPSRWSSICSRHFKGEDFNGMSERKTLKKTAIPSVRDFESSGVTVVQRKPRRIVPSEDEETIDNPSEGKTMLPPHNCTTAPKVNCRLCGCASTAVVTFSANFEIYGMIQKCFPTLNIQQHDNLGKEMCRVCLKRLEGFSHFIDKVLETQSELQRKYRTEKQSSSSKGTNERQLKIKQEPVVRVKQEVSEGFDSFLSDEMEMGVDDACCDQDHANLNTNDAGGTDVDQKYQLCDFPSMLNTQDIINNCDIMEIINLEDAFIDIPDDDGNTTIDEHAPIAVKQQQEQQEQQPQHQQQQQQQHPTLQQHSANMLSADFLLQTHLLIEEHNYANAAEDFKEEWQIKNNYKTEKSDEYGELDQDVEPHQHSVHSHDSHYQNINTSTVHDKPIVTSVAAVANDAHKLLVNHNVNTVVNGSGRSHTKPNIVVLNESIVQSSSAFQLQACSICHLKFFSVEALALHSLQQHNVQLPTTNAVTTSTHISTTTTHTTALSQMPPMVTVPGNKILPVPQFQPENYCKMEKGSDSNAMPQQLWSEPTVVEQHRPNHINILEMESLVSTFSQQQHSQQQQQLPPLQNNLNAFPSALQQPTVQQEFTTNTSTITEPTNNMTLQLMATNYNHLQRRYRQLQRKCRNLQEGRQPKKRELRTKRPTMRCQFCGEDFVRIVQLMRHKQLAAHYVRKPASRFAATCAGCEKFFRTKLALRNHMRYICSTLPLRQRQLLTFKCRHCRSITFTHWRLYRRHELKCRVKQEHQVKKQQPTSSKQIPKLSPSRPRLLQTAKTRQPRQQRCYTCLQCNKSFTSSNSLSQHNITHTQARCHKCNLCERHFKRRNGLTQHMKGFHLQLKPFTCPVCQHSYSLKCDMQRCRHSVLGGMLRQTTAVATSSPATPPKRQLGVV